MADMKSVEWEIDQLVKARLFPDEQSVLRSAMRSLFEAKPELKRKMVVTAYTNGEISLGKAAQIAGSRNYGHINSRNSGVFEGGPEWRNYRMPGIRV